MTAPQKRCGPGSVGALTEAERQKHRTPNSTKTRPRLPSNWRERLPDPDAYYRGRIAKLSKANALGWAQGKCPFHEDDNASLSVQVSGVRGCWRCAAGCGGGDLVGFEMKRTSTAFPEAVAELLRMRS